ncbi:hypothetical protein IKD67_01960 [Candidatus Saccharibacteria bacterium]|nr:hypothetical protein [Candidatus Saccharibacteria bacterium]
MFFESVAEISKIAKRCGTAIFVVPNNVSVDIKNALVISPEEKSVIAIEQVRKILPRLAAKQTADLFIMIRPAEAMNAEAANALLKVLEEPGEKVHFVLVTSEPSMILPTILSRAAVYIFRTEVNDEIVADDKIKELAKKLLVAKGSELVAITEEIAKKKDGVRAHALEVLGVAIEMLYKTYYITGKDVFVKKIPKFLAAYEGVNRNGHVKLQIVSNLC